ncbi:MAG TPA: hypothetical protein V6C89_01910 [Drouetiella sp.]|jgi:hypothetical protein
MTTVVNNDGTAPAVRKVLLSGGGNNGRIWDASYDHLYVIEVAPALGSAALPEGSFSVNNAVIRPLRYNATGKYEAVGEENLEIYEFVGFESMLVIERASLSSRDVLNSEPGVALVKDEPVVVRK